MSRKTIASLYIGGVPLAAVLLGALSTWLWPLTLELDRAWLIGTLAVLVTLTGRIYFKVSPDGEATPSTVPLFMAVLLLHPLETLLVAAGGILVAELTYKRPVNRLVFNVGANTTVAVVASMVYWALRPEEASSGVLVPTVILAAAAAGAAYVTTNVALVIGVISLFRGRGFLRHWGHTWAFEAVLELGFLALGLMGAHMLASGLWTLLILGVPLGVGYYAFKKSMGQVVQKAELAEELELKLWELRETQAQLVQSTKLATVGTLAAGVAHEINNPLTVISGRTGLLLARLRGGKGSMDIDKAASDVQDVYDMSQRISGIVSHLLSYSRASDKLSEERLDRLLDQSLPLLERKFEEKGVKLVRMYGESPTVNVVANQLEQVFTNLLSNSLDSIPGAGTITLGCSQENGDALAFVRDTGCGIPEELADRIFEPFFTTKEIGRGTGLGLFICRKIINDHGGDITVTTKRGEGTTFWIKLPAVVCARSTEALPATEDHAGQATLTRPG